MIFEYKVRAKHRLGFKEFKLYATTDIEEFFNRNNIEYVRNMTDTVEHRLLNEIERLNNIIEKTESMLKRLMEEQEYCYNKYPENWEERTGVSNTWLTSRDCYWSALNYLKKLKGSDKE